MKRSAPSVLALAALAVSLGFAGVEESVVLCFGGDGHVSIEASGPVGCSNATEAASRAASVVAVSIASSHCGPCIDVALTAAAATERVASARRAITPAALTPIPALAAVASRQRAAVWHRTQILVSEKPHTVVIRC